MNIFVKGFLGKFLTKDTEEEKSTKGRSGVFVRKLSVGFHDKITDDNPLFLLRVLFFLCVFCVLSFGKYYFDCLIFICTSRSCCSVTSQGAFISRSCAELFMGKATTSRMFSSSANSMTMRSMPGAIPAWGGAP